ncbi:hypothetical protein [Pseudomonas amygdali]|uniref:hypothetical protein n=1 Tax=Pseudomonas amygdali TaxID=47877 RepID=UPI001FB2C585|nr:hypothetical protein [Pseudomonas amygdali]UNO24014.1 hypothetical protein MDO45_16230 [Pseudomonas amygdali pv. aesculi]WGP98907.1 hypothetical protein QFG70_16505 [Pseudomonas amygdali pv. aesculi]
MKLSIACIGVLIFGEFLLEIGLPTTDLALIKAGLLALREPLIYSIFRPGNALEALIYLGATAGF